ncbi:resolvase [Azospirillum brasilense]|nr:resolvase [Azospirillum brasilense]
MATRRFVSYLRVSTQKQGQSGLGLDAQRSAVTNYLNGGASELVEEFLEVESGKRADRPVLARALTACRRHRAVLIVAKMDRLARNVAFVSNLLESGVEFVACDLPTANRLTIHILAAVAEAEAAAISQRTRVALAAAKERGVALGTPANLSNRAAGTARSAEMRSAQAKERALDLLPVVSEIQAGGVTSLSGIARAMTERSIPTPAGKSVWSAQQVRLLLDRIAQA